MSSLGEHTATRTNVVLDASPSGVNMIYPRIPPESSLVEGDFEVIRVNMKNEKALVMQGLFDILWWSVKCDLVEAAGIEPERPNGA